MKLSARSDFRVRDRHILLAFIGGIAVAICWGRLAFASDDIGVTGLFEGRLGANVGELLAIAALVSVVSRFRDEDLLSQSDLLAIAVTSLVFAVPALRAAALPVTVVGLVFFPKRDLRLSSIGQLLLALAFYEWLGRILFNLFSPVVLQVEAATVQALLSLFGGFTRDGPTIIAANGRGIYIETDCSAFHSLSLATLIWISLIKAQALPLQKFQWLVLATMAGATISLNTARLALLAQSRAQSDSLLMFNYWHYGQGYAIISLIMLAVMLGIFLGGQMLVQRR